MDKTNFWQKIRHQLIPNVGTIVIVALMLLGYSVYAAPSAQTTISTFPYQGTLTDASGNPVTDDVDMTFRIFDVSTGGTSLWTEAHTGANAVPVENGLFQLMLGSLVPIPESVWANNVLYLEVQTGTDTPMTPREMIGSVPRAIQADEALSVPDGALQSRHVQLHPNQLKATADVRLTDVWQKIPGTAITLTPETDQTYLVCVTVDIDLVQAIGIATLVVDGNEMESQAIFENQSGAGRGTVSQTYLVNLNAGTHTVVVQGKLVTTGTDVRIRQEHTTITYFSVSQ